MRQAARFFSFNKPSDWASGAAANMRIGPEGVSIERTEKYAVSLLIRGAEVDGADAVADFAVGPGNRLYVMDARAGVWIYDYENRYTETLFAPGHQLFSARARLAARGYSLFVTELEGERKIMAVSPSNGQLLWTRREWDGLELYPLAAAVDSAGCLYILTPLDTLPGEDGALAVPADGRLVIVSISPAGDAMHMYGSAGLVRKEAAPLRELIGRYVLAAGQPGEPVLFAADDAEVVAFAADGGIRNRFAIGEVAGGALSVDTRGALYIGDAGAVLAGQEERFIRKHAADGKRLAVVAGYRARADKLLHDDADRMYVLDSGNNAIAILDLESRTKSMTGTGIPAAWYISAALDSAEDETVWHKIELEAGIPEETQIRFSCFATDDTFGLLEGKVVRYDEYFDDPEIPLERKWQASRHLWSEVIVNPRDALLMQAKGRYLRFRLELVGSDRSAPLLRRLRIVFPRESPIRYLPPVYQEDADDSGFLERYLALFGTFLTEMEDKIERISASFDPDAVSGPYLRWLSGWLALDLAEDWDETRLRLLMKQAPELYKMRGTRRGLSRMLQLYTGVEPFIVEHHQLKTMQETSEMRQMIHRLYGDNPYAFCVMLPPECVRTDKQRLTVEAIISDQKPAYTEGKLIVLQPWMHADMHTYLGINTVLSEPTLLTLDQQATLPHHTVLVDPDREKRIDTHTRLELDSELE